MESSLLPSEVDILLVGAGPIGIEIGAALKSNGLEYLHVEAGDVASTIGWYSPGTTIFSSPDRIAIAGIPFTTYPWVKATREDYLNYLRGVVRGLNLSISQNTRLVGCHKIGDRFHCELVKSDWSVGGPEYRSLDDQNSDAKHSLTCRSVILAIGDMHHPRYLGVEGESNKNVTHYLPELHTLFGKRVVIVGAKNSAAEAVVRLARINQEIVVIHRGEGFEPVRVKPWLLPEIKSLIADGRVRFLGNSEVIKIEASRALVKTKGEEGIVEVPFDRMLLLTGYDQDATLFERIGIRLDGESKAPDLNLQTMESSVPGLYVAGTAVAGSQQRGVKVFIENCHVHVQRILDHLLGKTAKPLTKTDREEIHREL